MTPQSRPVVSHLMEFSKKKSIFQNIEDLIAEPTTSQDKLECPLCSKSYVTFFGLRRHLKSHVDGRVEQTCPHCSKHYNHQHRSLTGSNSQNNEVFPERKRSFRSAGALKMHLNTHSLPCSCKICGKSFSRPWLLKGHLRIHTGEKPYGCPVEGCGRSFADKSNLRAHEQTHSAIKKHKCLYCNSGFARAQMKTKHEQHCGGQPASQ